MGLKPGVLKAYPRRQGAKAFTAAAGKGPEDRAMAGKVDTSVTVYKEQVNDVTQSRLLGFIQRAAAALSVNKSELIIEDSRGMKRLGESQENGTNLADSIPRLK